MCPAKRSGTEFRLAALQQRQAIMQRQHTYLLWMCVVYKTLVIPKGILVGVFLELWLRTISLELWLRTISLELWLGIEDEYEESLIFGSDWRVLLV